MTILSDCQSAILSIQNPRYQSGQHLIENIWVTARAIWRRGTKLVIQWTPGHEGVTGNKLAHQSARKATDKGSLALATTTTVRLKSRALQVGRLQIKEIRKKEFDKKSVGKVTRKLDKALPQEHMVAVYNQLRMDEAKILTQLRTNFSPLKQHLKMIRVAESEECSCGNPTESTYHFLFECQNWTEERKPLREAMSHRWADLSYALG